MATYGYGPPPPAPPAAAPSGPAPGFVHYGQYQHQQPQHSHTPSHGGHSGRGGRGGHSGRGDYHGQPAAPYTYTSQPAPSYPGHHGPPPAHTPLPPQNYHPNYAPQIYQQPQYGQPQPYPPAPPQTNQHPYGQHYPAQHPQQSGGHAPPQHWGGPPPASLPHQHQLTPTPTGPSQFGGGRGRGGHHGHSDRGGHKGAGGATAATMGPPIRMGFDNRQDQQAPVSNGYPQPYGHPQTAPAPYPSGPYQAYPHPPPAAAPISGSVHYDPYYTAGVAGSHPQNGVRHHHTRGGYPNSAGFKGRLHMGGDKMRHSSHHHKKPGGSIPTTPHSHHQKPDAASAGKKKKRKTNTLGLTPGEESDDDVDEEEKLVELIGPDAPNPTDIAAWIAERRARYPTQARIKAKAAAESVARGDRAKDGNKEAVSPSLKRQELKLEKLRKQMEKVESSIKRKREQQDEGDDMRDVTASTSVSYDSKSDSEKPDVLPSRPDPATIPPPAKKADPSKHCKYYSTGGICGKKGKCRFVHDDAVRQAALREREMNGGRMTLQQRLTLNDKDQEDLTIVKTLQYLKEKGLMSESQPGNQTDQTGDGQAPIAAQKSCLPPPPIKLDTTQPARSSLPPQPPAGHTDRYHGWDLSGFGNTGVKRDV